jgi:tetratricopeptide (TPR) repeat protein
VSSRRRAGDAIFFDALREAESRLPAGLVRLNPPASIEAIAAAERRVGKPLPHAYAEFLRSFDGADLFHEALVVYGVTGRAQSDLAAHNVGPTPGPGHDDEIVIAEHSSGQLFTLELEAPETHDAPRVFRIEVDEAGNVEERWLAGSSFPRWLEGTIAHEALLYDSDGEFLAEAFEEDGEELTPTFALRQTERALRKDPGSALYHHEKGVALRRLGRLEPAREAFRAAAAADPTNPWPWFDLGRADHALGRFGESAAAFECAAEAAPGPESARFAAWAARAFHLAGERATAERLRLVALERDRDVVEALKQTAQAAREGGDEDAADDAAEIADLLGGNVPLARRLTVLSSAAPRPMPAKPERPSPPSPRKPGGKPKPPAPAGKLKPPPRKLAKSSKAKSGGKRSR